MRIDRVDNRAKLAPRRDPYWQKLSEGRYIGFRYMTKGSAGTWVARFYNGTGYVFESLGDFATLPEKDRYDAAVRAADAWFEHLDMGGTTEKVTVKQACEAYVDHQRQEKGEAAAADVKGRFERLVYDDPLGRIVIQKLAPRHLADWKKRVLGNGGSRGSFNRNATALRAALNLAYRRRDVATDHAWRDELKPLENAVKRRTLYLDPQKRKSLVESASEESRPFFQALNLLPLRPGEMASLKVEHLNALHRCLEIPTGKTEARIIPLPDEALAHFKACAKNKLPGAWLIARASGDQWKKEAWRDEIKLAVAAAHLPSGTVAYTLRHSLITDLVTGGLDIFTVAKISGTSVLMIEKHYGHLQREHARTALSKLALA